MPLAQLQCMINVLTNFHYSSSSLQHKITIILYTDNTDTLMDTDGHTNDIIKLGKS